MAKTSSCNLVPFQYWRSALAEVALCNPEVPADDKPIEILNDEGRWKVAGAKPNLEAWIAKQFESSKTSGGGDETDLDKTVPLVLIPARLSACASHGVKFDAEDVNTGQTILCIPCLMDRRGTLMPDPERQPWIPRDLLEPSLKGVTIGQLDRQDRFLSAIPGKAVSLGEVFSTAGRLFEEVTESSLPLLAEYVGNNKPLPSFEMDGYEVVSEWHGLSYSPPIIARHLIKLYDQLITKAPKAPTLDKLRSTSELKTRAPIEVPNAEKYYLASVGHVDQKHPLSPSQREALVELIAMQTGEILAVNGPPGTGKTTLLQSVVAQLWVDAALRGAECPLILATSTNVKAVENILDSFGRMGDKINHQRWLPYDGGFGLFFASASRDTKFPTCTSDTHPFVAFEKADAVSSAQKLYLSYATKFFGESQESVDVVVKALHSKLTGLYDRLREIIKVRYKIFVATGSDITRGAETLCEKYLAAYGREKLVAQELLSEVEEVIAQNHKLRRELEARYEEDIARVNAVEKSWSEYIASSPIWMDLLSFFPPISRRRNARDRAFLLKHKLTENLQSRHDDVAGHFHSLRKVAYNQRQEQNQKLLADVAVAEAQKAQATVRLREATNGEKEIRRLHKAWLNTLGGEYGEMSNVSLIQMNDVLDTLIRAPMFCITDWYWSGRWLLEVQDRLEKQTFDTKGVVRLEAKYRRFAKLSPCLVSNFHMAPSFFTAWQGEDLPLWNAIDLLIVDEAGQVSPDVGAGMFALAKRALVVGDIYQIEPVWNTGETSDRSNASKFGLVACTDDPRYEMLAIDGYTTSKGSLMKMAGRGCTVQKHEDIRGLLLTEHRRCVPELVSYCNKLVYGGRLHALRPSLPPEKRLYPVFGGMDVRGVDRKVGTSRQNYEEAKAIVNWLKENRTRIESHYRDAETGQEIPIWKTVGVITPFSTQARQIEKVLRKELPELMRKDTRLTVGTVHALQGAEREIIIFSPTYGNGYKGGMFFDRSINMLNVAVSRAKDSFLVIGNLGLFDATKKSRPSGLLATYLAAPEFGGII